MRLGDIIMGVGVIIMGCYYYGGSLQTCNEDKYCFLLAPWIISPTAVMLLEQFLNYSVMLLPMVSQAVMTS